MESCKWRLHGYIWSSKINYREIICLIIIIMLESTQNQRHSTNWIQFIKRNISHLIICEYYNKNYVRSIMKHVLNISLLSFVASIILKTLLYYCNTLCNQEVSEFKLTCINWVFFLIFLFGLTFKRVHNRGLISIWNVTLFPSDCPLSATVTLNAFINSLIKP